MESLQSNWVKYGAISGLLSIVLSLIIYYVMPMSIWVQSILGLGIMTVIMVMGGKAERNDNGGVLSYSKALGTTFLVGVVGLTISTLFLIILTQIIDPGLVDKLTETSIDAAKSMMESFGMSEDQMEAAIEKVEEDAAKSFTPVGLLFNILKGSVFILIFAALVSLFIRKTDDPNKISISDIGTYQE